MFYLISLLTISLQLDFLTEDFHANMLMVIHAPSGVNPSPGKAFAVFDPNVINTTEGMPNKRMQQLVRSVVKDKPLTPVYLNKLPKDRNNDGRCLQRALLHMLDLINCGKQFSANIQRSVDGKVAVVEGYRPVLA
jgi:hypothetical protein